MRGCIISPADLGKLCSEPGELISGAALARTQRALGADFSNIVLHHSCATVNACQRLGAAAFTAREHVFFAEDISNLEAPTRLRVLAHELAHVLQQRRGYALAPAPRSHAAAIALEIEADAAADAVLRGATFRVRLADASREPACWKCAAAWSGMAIVRLPEGPPPRKTLIGSNTYHTAD
jgi:hypothetical protein